MELQKVSKHKLDEQDNSISTSNETSGETHTRVGRRSTLRTLGVGCSSVLSPLPDSVVVAVFWGMVIVVTPVIQYAWTFFYLRLVEVEYPLNEAPPMYAELPPAASSAANGHGEAVPQETPPQPIPDPDQA